MILRCWIFQTFPNHVILHQFDFFFHLFSQFLPDSFKPKTLGVRGQVLRAADWELRVHRLHPQGPQGPQGHRGHRVLVAWVAVTWGLAGCPSWGFSGCFKHIFCAKWDDPNSKLTTDDFAGTTNQLLFGDWMFVSFGSKAILF